MISISSEAKKYKFLTPHVWLATWFGSGFITPAPGSWGTLAALPFGCIVLYVGGWELLALLSLCLFPIGVWATAKFEKASGVQDNSMIVIDEVIGMWMVLCFAGLSVPFVVLAFVLFRFFDIVKPWPVSFFDRMKTPVGVMLDDVVAAIYACIILCGVQYFL